MILTYVEGLFCLSAIAMSPISLQDSSEYTELPVRPNEDNMNRWAQRDWVYLACFVPGFVAGFVPGFVPGFVAGFVAGFLYNSSRNQT